MIDTSRNLFEEHSGTYLYHLAGQEEVRMDLEQGKTLSLTGKPADPSVIGLDYCDIVTTKEKFAQQGSRYFRDLAEGKTIGVILDSDHGVLLSPQILEEEQETRYTVAFEGGWEFSLSAEEIDRALEIVDVAAVDRPDLSVIHEKMTQQAESGQKISLTLEDGSQLMQVWQDEDMIYRLLGSCPNDMDSHIMDAFQNYDGKKEQIFANVMERLQKEQPDRSLTEEDLEFGKQMTLDEFGLE